MPYFKKCLVVRWSERQSYRGKEEKKSVSPDFFLKVVF